MTITQLIERDTEHRKYCLISNLEGGEKSTMCHYCVTNENKISAINIVFKGL